MKHVGTMVFTGLTLSALMILSGVLSPARGAEPASDSQLKRLMETAAQAPDSPDHEYVGNSLHSMLRQSKDLNLTKEQTEKIKTITDQYERTRRDREQAYKQSEMEALKLIHDSRSSMSSIEQAVQKADQDHSRLRLAGIKALREARDVLRPEQYGTWRQNHAARQMSQGNPHREARGTDVEPDETSRIAPH